MQNFDYMTPTRLIFGRDSIEKLPEVMRPLGRRVLLTYGGGSIKKIGLYDKVKALLADFEIHELPGIQPNPKYDPSVLDGVQICKEQEIDVILAVGGGSVLDCSKAIAAGAKYDGDPWDLISYKDKRQNRLRGSSALPSVLHPRPSLYLQRVEKADRCGVRRRYEPRDGTILRRRHHPPQRRLLRGRAAEPHDERPQMSRQSRRLHSTRRNDALLHLRLQRDPRPRQFLLWLALPWNRTRAERILRHHPRRRPRDHHPALDAPHPQRHHYRPLRQIRRERVRHRRLASKEGNCRKSNRRHLRLLRKHRHPDAPARSGNRREPD